MNSLAKWFVGAGSKGLRTMVLSKGSPGNNDQWSKTLKQKAYPDVCTLRSVSNPKWSIVGMWALTTEKGVPGFAYSDKICPLLLKRTLWIAGIQSWKHIISVNNIGSMIFGVAIRNDE